MLVYLWKSYKHKVWQSCKIIFQRFWYFTILNNKKNNVNFKKQVGPTPKLNYIRKCILGKKKVLYSTKFWLENFLIQNKFESKKFWAQKILCQKLLIENKFSDQKLLGPKIFLAQNFGLRKIFGPKNFKLDLSELTCFSR